MLHSRLVAVALTVALGSCVVAAVAPVAAALGIAHWQGACTPVQKVAAVEALVASGHKVLMAGDGLNDSASLAAAI